VLRLVVVVVVAKRAHRLPAEVVAVPVIRFGISP